MAEAIFNAKRFIIILRIFAASISIKQITIRSIQFSLFDDRLRFNAKPFKW